MASPNSIILTAAIGWIFNPIAAFAEDASQANKEPLPCTTHMGSGALFNGYFSTLIAPEETEGFSVVGLRDDQIIIDESMSDAIIKVFGDIRLGQNVLVYAQASNELESKNKVEFKDAKGEVLQTCHLTVVAFDPVKHDASTFEFGFCEFNRIAKVSRVPRNKTLIFDLPEKYVEGATSSPNVLEFAPLKGARQVKLIGKTAGLATFVWLARDVGNGMLRGVCPVIVS